MHDHLLHEVFAIRGAVAIRVGDLEQDLLVLFEQFQKLLVPRALRHGYLNSHNSQIAN
ncbi:MAG TPA: hypothetical protein VG055_20475 [Planctomycetaceae bacterium]|nr:hypothetical protein [Planctomycetaceae bacterium]